MLNPERKVAIQFGDFVRGMLSVAEDSELRKIMSLDRPNRFQLLSLVIDSVRSRFVFLHRRRQPDVSMLTAQPTNDELESVLFNRMSGAEKLGVRALKGLVKKNQTSEQVQATVREGCRGRLHYLEPKAMSRVDILHYVCVLQALTIGLLTTLVPGLIENFLVEKFETDGAVDAYWTCPGADNEVDALPSTMQPPYQNLSLPYCPYGLCTSVPANITQYLDAGGNAAMGGTWTNEQLLTDVCGLIDEEAACSPQQSCAASTWKLCTKAVELQCSPLPKTPVDFDRLAPFWAFNIA